MSGNTPTRGFEIGQEVLIYGKYSGTVVEPEREDMPNTEKEVWVFNHSRSYASRYAAHNVKPIINSDDCEADTVPVSREALEALRHWVDQFDVGREQGLSIGQNVAAVRMAKAARRLLDGGE